MVRRRERQPTTKDNGNNGESDGENNGEDKDNGAGCNEGAKSAADNGDGAAYEQNIVTCPRSGTLGVRFSRSNGGVDGASSGENNGAASGRNNDSFEAKQIKVELLGKGIELLNLQNALFEKEGTMAVSVEKASNDAPFETLMAIIPTSNSANGASKGKGENNNKDANNGTETGNHNADNGNGPYGGNGDGEQLNELLQENYNVLCMQSRRFGRLVTNHEIVCDVRNTAGAKNLSVGTRKGKGYSNSYNIQFEARGPVRDDKNLIANSSSASIYGGAGNSYGENNDISVDKSRAVNNDSDTNSRRTNKSVENNSKGANSANPNGDELQAGNKICMLTEIFNG
ncbi:hyphally regulated cell wall protein 3-like, partial [Rhagoletis pomonella]|uniref:hyphally regulated cell wall protein 3-like n=1 Tax=Rhagoletis pomonella TaxID=28610 RepID=UPI001784E621